MLITCHCKNYSDYFELNTSRFTQEFQSRLKHKQIIILDSFNLHDNFTFHAFLASKNNKHTIAKRHRKHEDRK